ncbi:MAG TPA: hypothetical protein VGV37_24975 [Aliidongia sp.]|uniref:hypothetical protein n=1 Tax=Aliidongia sp. TaxID=1914230 RepID=UPI002DDD8A7A|nr:hypothetical protein [Aliidongia sp.]HEV2677809.1 hypothetical protein [Aliidongia sp.]
MIRRIVLIVVAAAACAGCASSETPNVSGRDALGLPVYTLGGGGLAQLELAANSNCPGGTRPYYKSFAGSSGNMSVTYTCE